MGAIESLLTPIHEAHMQTFTVIASFIDQS